MDPGYDCIIVVLGHSEYKTNEPSYRPMFPGCSVTTILLANPGVWCFSSVDEVKTEVEENFNKTEEEFLEGDGLFGKTPQDVLDVFSEALKPGKGDEEHPSMGYKHPTYHAEYCKFVDCPGSISNSSDMFFNKLWEFDDENPKEIGCIMLIFRQPGNGIKIIPILESEIRDGGFTISKSDLLIRLFTRTPFRRPLLLDFGCSGTSGTPENIAIFTEKGIYGGTKKYKDKISRIKPAMDKDLEKRILLEAIVEQKRHIHSKVLKKFKKGGRRRTRRR